MKVLFMGDVMGAPGARAIQTFLPSLRAQVHPDLVIANGENMADGAGMNQANAELLFDAGVDVITNGNHVWDKAQTWSLIAQDSRLLRPHNMPPGSPGSGWWVGRLSSGIQVGVLNLLGTTFMHPVVGCPFRHADAVLETKPSDVKIIIVDFHAETTLEKTALGWYLNGRVSAVLGTHTHIPTADERVLAGGTAYITDVGMCGCYDSAIGLGIENALQRFVAKRPAPYDVAAGRATLCAVLVEIDDSTGRAIAIQRIRRDEA